MLLKYGSTISTVNVQHLLVFVLALKISFIVDLCVVDIDIFGVVYSFVNSYYCTDNFCSEFALQN